MSDGRKLCIVDMVIKVADSIFAFLAIMSAYQAKIVHSKIFETAYKPFSNLI